MENRLIIKGKFFYQGKEKFFIKGVTYGTFAPNEDNIQFPPRHIVEKDFFLMSTNGINSVRTYTVPPIWLLDVAHKYNLKVMVGIPWEQHITFLDTKSLQKDIIFRIKQGVELCTNHPAVLCYTIGNEIPAPIVRWYGKERIEKFLRQVYKVVKQVDPLGLVTYVNYPTTEYLNLSFLDFDCFNVYLETPEKLSAYISRLHNLSGDRPLVLAEIGLDSMRNGELKQASVMDWQIKTVFGKGCAGMFVFSWTDEWWRGGFEIEDWDFGLVNRERKPKAALYSVAAALRSVPFSNEQILPFISVIVCTLNGSATIKDTMEGLRKLRYPNFEVIVVNDGSTDNTAEIVRQYPYKLISTKNNGLSSARNVGMAKAKGEIIAYIDDDAYPDSHWLHYLAYAYINTNHGAMGGPNIIPPEDGSIAFCIANAPGGPVHVLKTDEIAEHVPGCNLSVRRDVLMKIGGFDPMYRAAGDDVDVCWRIQEAGYTIGYHPSALVWHHRRNSLKAYWKQQKGYGKAEALLEAKWPEKYNGFGHLSWEGKIYGNGVTKPIKFNKEKVFHGSWGSALFQSVYQPANGFLHSIPLMPEWYIFCLLFAFLGCLGFLWQPLLLMWVVFAASISIIIIQAIMSASINSGLSKKKKWKYKALIILLHIIQPIARLTGRIQNGLTPWRNWRIKTDIKKIKLVTSCTLFYWNEAAWKATDTWLEEVEQALINMKVRVKRGGVFDNWDIKAATGLFAQTKGIVTVEEHGANKQYVKFRYNLTYSIPGMLMIFTLSAIAIAAAAYSQWVVMTAIGIIVLALAMQFIQDSVTLVACLHQSFQTFSIKSDKETTLNIIYSNNEDEVDDLITPHEFFSQGEVSK